MRMLRFLWRWLKRGLFVLAVLGIALGTFVAYLVVTTMEPRASDTWQKAINDLPGARGEAAAAIGVRLTDDATPPGEPGEGSLSQLFVIGGLAGLGSTVDTVDVFDPAGGEWAPGPPLPEPRHHPGAAGIGGVVYVSGGASTALDWTPTDTFWQLLPLSDEWEELPPLPDARMGHRMVALQGKLYVVGGRGETSNVLIYDPADGTWSTGAQMPEPRDHLGVAVTGLQIYAIGGRDEALTDRVDIYDVITDRWTVGPPVPEPMSAMAVGTLSDGIHVVGGEDPATIGGGVIDRHFVLRPGTEEWREAPLPILATHGSASAVLRGSLVIAGGARRQGALSPLGWTGLVQVYTPGVSASPSPEPEGN